MSLQNALNAPFPLSPTLGGLGVASPTSNGVLIAKGLDPVESVTLSDGQIIIGRSGNVPLAASITGGTGITVTNGANSITISTNESENWTEVSATTQALEVNTNYICTNAGVTTLTLPSVAPLGSVIEITSTASTYIVAQNAAQSIKFMGVSTTTGVTGTYTSDVVGAAVRLVCVLENSTWQVLSALGNPTLD